MRHPTATPAAAMMDALMLGLEAQSVVALRLWRLSGGGTAAALEAQRMIVEKVDALWRAQLAASLALARGDGGEAAAAAAMRPIRRVVRANRRRLSSL